MGLPKKLTKLIFLKEEYSPLKIENLDYLLAILWIA
jgi:hypothetical protein